VLSYLLNSGPNSAGVGRITSIALSKAGWSVALFARRADELENAARECPGKTLVVQGDVTSETDVARFFSEAVKAFGECSI
jgi:NADP-dependent 3-hydroxy acid dehydrogenase YdfG